MLAAATGKAARLAKPPTPRNGAIFARNLSRRGTDFKTLFTFGRGSR